MKILKYLLISTSVTLAFWVLIRVVYSLIITFYTNSNFLSSVFWQNFSVKFYPNLNYRIFGLILFIIVLFLITVFRKNLSK
jgi:hypothetical protein